MRIPNLHHSDPYWLTDTEYGEPCADPISRRDSVVTWSEKENRPNDKWKKWLIGAIIVGYIILIILTNES